MRNIKHNIFMQRAIYIAENAINKTMSFAGCVIVDIKNNIISEGFNCNYYHGKKKIYMLYHTPLKI